MDNYVLAAAIAVAVRKVMQEEGVATKSGLAKIGSTLERHEHKMDSLEKRLAALQQEHPKAPVEAKHREQERERGKNQQREHQRHT